LSSVGQPVPYRNLTLTAIGPAALLSGKHESAFKPFLAVRRTGTRLRDARRTRTDREIRDVTRSRQEQNGKTERRARGGSAELIVFAVLFGLFGLNVLLGKASVQLGWDLPLLGDVAEFLLLLLATAVLTLAGLRRESDTGDDNP